MKNEILRALGEIERQNGVRALFACESGSRAWGFPSADSDYDVRFIYAGGARRYLSVENKPDTISAMLPGDLDMSGWDIRKALGLFAKSNAALFEWLDSPLVYRDLDGFSIGLKNLIPDFFEPRKAMYHYSTIADNAIKKHLSGNFISVKKLMYVLRAYLACEWILQKSSMPPTLFENIYTAVASADLRREIENLVREKADLNEKSGVEIKGAIAEFVKGGAKYFDMAKDLPAARRAADVSELDNIICSLVL